MPEPESAAREVINQLLEAVGWQVRDTTAIPGCIKASEHRTPAAALDEIVRAESSESKIHLSTFVAVGVCEQRTPASPPKQLEQSVSKGGHIYCAGAVDRKT